MHEHRASRDRYRSLQRQGVSIRSKVHVLKFHLGLNLSTEKDLALSPLFAVETGRYRQCETDKTSFLHVSCTLLWAIGAGTILIELVDYRVHRTDRRCRPARKYLAIHGHRERHREYRCDMDGERHQWWELQGWNDLDIRTVFGAIRTR